MERGQAVAPNGVMAQRNLSISEMLDGEVAGVQAFNADGAPGAAAELRIRSRGTLRGDLQPLNILDGVMLTGAMLDNGNPWNSFDKTDYQVVANPLGFINPQDIESVTVLKNASATAIYGDRGAGGVVIIKTRNGAKTPAVTTATVNMGVRTPASRWDLLPGDGYKSFINRKGTATPDNAQWVDWQDKLLGAGFDQNYNLNVSGTTKGTDYLLSLYLSSQDGIVKNSGTTSAGIRVNIDQSINPKLRVGARALVDYNNTSMTQSVAYLGGSSAILALANPPYLNNSGITPLSIAGDYQDIGRAWHLVPQLYGTYNIVQGLQLNVNTGIDNFNKLRRRWLGNGTEKGLYENGRASRSTLTSNNYNVDGSLDFERTFASIHTLKLSAQASYYGTNCNQIMQSGSDFFSSSLQANGIGSASVLYPPGYEKQNYNALSFAGHASYALDHTLLVSGGLRGDRIVGMEKDFQPYPFVNVGWNLSRERFWRSSFVGRKALTGLEFSVGWGISGKGYASPASSLSNLTLDDPSLYVPFETNLYYTGLWRAVLNEWNAGLNAELLGGRIKAAFEYYSGKSDDRLAVYNRAPKRLYDILWSDKMSLERSGMELSLLGLIFKNRDWAVSAKGNIALPRVRVTDSGSNTMLGGTRQRGFVGRSVGIVAGESDFATAFINGYAPGVFYGYKTEGLMTTDNVAFAPPFKGQQLQQGDVKFIDVNGDGQVDRNDKVVIGDPNPKFFGGFDLKGSWKRLSLALRFDYSSGNDILNLNLLTLDNVNGQNNIRDKAYWDMVPGASTPWRNVTGLDQISDRMVEDGSYFRLATVTVSYSVPLKSKSVRALEVNFMASNLFTATNYSGFSPVVNSFAGDWSLAGIDLGAYPQPRFFSLGVSARF